MLPISLPQELEISYVLRKTKRLCEKFINKVETGRARSKETYKECKELLELINKLEMKL